MCIDNILNWSWQYLTYLLLAFLRVQAVVVASGHDLGVIRDLFNGVDKGTIFMDRPPSLQVRNCFKCFSHSYGSGGGAQF